MKSVDAKIKNYENTAKLLKQYKADYSNKVAALKAFKVAYTDYYGVRDDVVSGTITIEQAALELYKAGWMCFDAADAKRLLKIK